MAIKIISIKIKVERVGTNNSKESIYSSVLEVIDKIKQQILPLTQ